MEKKIKNWKIVEMKDGKEVSVDRVFVSQISEVGDSIGVRTFTDTEDVSDVIAFRLAMLGDLSETGMLKAAADDGMIDDAIRNRAAVLCSKLISQCYDERRFPCQMCRHETPCGEGICDMYEEDKDGFCCIDDSSLDCKKTKGTPCEGCMLDNFKNFCLKTELI